MKLGIISDCLHIKDQSGRIGSYVHIFVRQMDNLSSAFEKTIICAPVVSINENHPKLTYYENSNITFIELPHVGGPTLPAKIRLIKTIPLWIGSFKKLSGQVDILYQRFPNNLNIPGFFYSHLIRKKKFATYTGVWGPFKGEEPTIWLQRMLLKHFFKGPVFVYSYGKDMAHGRIYTTISPSYTLSDWEEEETTFQKKIGRIDRFEPEDKLILINVASLVPHKNQLFLLKAMQLLKNQQVTFHLYIVGQGKERQSLQEFIDKNQLNKYVTLTGQIQQDELRNLYRKADFVIQPPLWEGYGKVPIEGIFHAVVPILSHVNLHPYFAGIQEERGGLFHYDHPQNLVNVLMKFAGNKELWRSAVVAGRKFAASFTMEEWKNSILSTLESYYRIKIISS